MFLHTANRLWRLGACREGQLHSDTCRRDGGVGTERVEDEMERQRGRDAEERGGRTDVSNSREDESSDGESAASRRPFWSG